MKAVATMEFARVAAKVAAKVAVKVAAKVVVTMEVAVTRKIFAVRPQYGNLAVVVSAS